MKTKTLIYGICFFALPNFAIAQNLNPQNPETIVVSATKNPKPINSVAASVTVIDGNTIEKAQSIQLIDAVKSVSGISFARNGGYGQTTSIFIRGGESHDTLLIIDGVVMNEPSLPAGNFDFGNLILNDIQRIEILKGPQSVLYGSDAIGGVISVNTNSPKAPFEAFANLEFGSLDTQLSRLGIGGKIENANYSVSIHNFNTDGISAKAKSTGGLENEGAKISGVNSRFGYEISANTKLDFRANYSESQAGFDGFPPPFYNFADTAEYSKIKQSGLYFGVINKAFDERLKSEFALKGTQSDRRNFDPSISPDVTYIATSANQTFEYSGNLAINKSLDLVFGALKNQHDYSSRSPASWDPNPAAARAKASMDSFYSELQFDYETGLALTLGGRYDDHSSFGDNTTFRASLAYSPRESGTRFHINYGQGFKAPSLFQIYSDYGNPNILPETADALEIGISKSLSPYWQISLIGFQRKSENQIDYFSCFGSSAPLCSVRPFGFYDNIKKAQIEGFEFETNYRVNNLKIAANYTNIDAKNKTIGSANFGKALGRRPKESANIEVNYDWSSRFSTAISYSYVGPRFDDAANLNRLKAYDTMGLRAELKLNDKFDIYGRIENASDSEYQIVRNYGTMPRTFTIGIRARY